MSLTIECYVRSNVHWLRRAVKLLAIVYRNQLNRCYACTSNISFTFSSFRTTLRQSNCLFIRQILYCSNMRTRNAVTNDLFVLL